MIRSRRFLLLLLLPAVISLTGGCAALTRGLAARDYGSPATRELVSRIASRNNDLSGFKGIGKLRLRGPDGRVSLRAAWMGLYPDRLRFELMNAGQPMAKLAVDGQWFTLISHAEDRFYETRSANPSLNRLVGVPVRAADMIALLSGRIPLAPFHHADIRKEEGRWQLVLSHWGRTVQRLYLDDERKRVEAIERFNGKTSFRYRATIADLRMVGGYRIPFALDLSDDTGSGFSLVVDRYWADAEIDRSRFRLLPADGQ